MTTDQKQTDAHHQILVGDQSDEYYLVTDLPKVVPGKPHRSTCMRWILTGVLAEDGTRTKLQSSKVGGRRVVSKNSLLEFLERLNADPACQHHDARESTSSSPPATRAKQAGKALEDLRC